MSDEERDLENPDEWDWEAGRMQQPSKERRTIVSVAFSRPDFEKVAGAAEQRGMPVSRFIRSAALEQAERDVRVTTFGWSAGNQGYSFIPNAVLLSTGTLWPRGKTVRPDKDTDLVTAG